MELARRKRGELKAEKEAARLARENAKLEKKNLIDRMREKALNSLIGVAVRPLCDLAIERTIKNCNESIAAVEAKLKEHKGNVNAFAPYPKRSVFNRIEREQAISYRNFVHSLTETIKNSYHSTGYDSEYGAQTSDYLYKISKEKCAEYIKRNKDATFDFYVSFVQKLNSKVGEVTDAVLTIDTGTNVWGLSILTITKPDGTKENWKTQVIVNCSVLGKLFNQWPTRKVK